MKVYRYLYNDVIYALQIYFSNQYTAIIINSYLVNYPRTVEMEKDVDKWIIMGINRYEAEKAIGLIN